MFVYINDTKILPVNFYSWEMLSEVQQDRKTAYIQMANGLRKKTPFINTSKEFILG